jgi:ferric-dicitrate binding protein FerR (iron transport regulator)
MTSCDTARKLIEKILEGAISQTELAKLKAHTETCPACREELRRRNLLEEVLKEALVPSTPAELARVQVLAKVASTPRPRTDAIQLSRMRTAVAASIILVVGLLLGFLGGRVPLSRSALVRVPMQVGDLEGMVLVRHDNSDVWQPLQSGAAVYRGDTFHSMAKAEFVLELENNSRIRVNPSSILALVSYGDETEFSLEQGECTASLQSPHGPFFIDTPNGRAEALGTEFTVTVE